MKPRSKAVQEYMAEFARQGGLARAQALTKEQRQAIGRKGAAARWGKKVLAKQLKTA